MNGRKIDFVRHFFFKYYAYMYRHIMVGVDAIIVSMKCFVGSHGTLVYELIKEDISVPRYICVTK